MAPFRRPPSKELTPENALARAMALCARREYATGEVLEKLLSWGITRGQASGIIDHLKRERYLDDRRFAHAFCHDKFQFNGWGKTKISLMLRSKGVDSDIIGEALDQLDDEEYETMARQLLVAKLKTLQGREPRSMRASLARYAASRGFEADVFFPIIEQLLGASCNEGDF